MSDTPPGKLDALVDWMRTRGVTALSAEGVSLTLGPEPKPSPPPLSAEEREVDEQRRTREARRARYATEFGFTPDDVLLERLP